MSVGSVIFNNKRAVKLLYGVSCVLYTRVGIGKRNENEEILKRKLFSLPKRKGQHQQAIANNEINTIEKSQEVLSIRNGEMGMTNERIYEYAFSHWKVSLGVWCWWWCQENENEWNYNDICFWKLRNENKLSLCCILGSPLWLLLLLPLQ